ncbi:MAG TPA: substrate-binding domain-containing protein [Azospirillaceae bacterium]|nr:substrate-binding domain-containing protein [Azospirillaceae bacterium]
MPPGEAAGTVGGRVRGGARRLALLLALALPLLQAGPAPAGDVRLAAQVERARRLVADAAALEHPWGGPWDGPRAEAGHHIVFLAFDPGNGGIQGVLDGVQEAAAVLSWRVTVLDGGADEARSAALLREALAGAPSAVILGGADAARLTELMGPGGFGAVPVFAWHGGVMPGRIPGTPVIFNVSTNAGAVADLAAAVAVADSDGRAGVVILADPGFSIAMEKGRVMRRAIEQCGGCEVLAFEEVRIAEARREMPGVVARLRARFGARWTHTLAINDVYFDAMEPVLAEIGSGAGPVPRNISAGDGSASAFRRLAEGRFQAATVPEPLLMQGWQLLDEVNRHLAGKPVSGFVPPVAVVTPETVAGALSATGLFDPPTGYRAAYRRIWGVEARVGQ